MLPPPDEVVHIKVRAIERGVARAREEYDKGPSTFTVDITRQDAAVMNIQRACVAALDCGQHLVRRDRLGIPVSARDVFSLLAAAGWISGQLASSLQNLVDFRELAIHNDEALQSEAIVVAIRDRMGDLLAFGHQMQEH